MTTQNGARRSCTWARRIISDYIFRIAILSNITLKRLPTILEELNETIFQMKDAKYFSFKELQLNMDNWLKSHIIYKKHSLKTVHTETNKTIVEVDIHCCHGWRLQKSQTNDTIKLKNDPTVSRVTVVGVGG